MLCQRRVNAGGGRAAIARGRRPRPVRRLACLMASKAHRDSMIGDTGDW
jgi:hypothetical protein